MSTAPEIATPELTTGEPRDFLGRTIHVGDVLVYARNAGRSATLNMGAVTAITYSITVYTPRRAMLAGLASPVLHVEIADDQWDANLRRTIAGLSHTRLYFPERTVLVDIDSRDMWTLMKAHIDRRFNEP